MPDNVAPDIPITLGYFAYENNGEIRNCINTGEIVSQFNTIIVQMGSFVTKQYGKMQNCVNTALVQHEFTYKEGRVSGAGAIAFETDTGAEYEGVFNVGECINGRIDDKYIDENLHGLFYRTTVEGNYPDMSRMKNYR